MMKYPVVYKYIDQVGPGDWSVVVTLCGRSLMAFEDDEWWAEAVDPGGMAGHGPTPTLANKCMHESWTAVLDDLAEQAADLAEFSSKLRALVAQVNEPADREWSEFRRQIRQSDGDAEGPFANVDKVTDDVVAWVTVQDVSAAPADEFESLRPAA